MQQRAEALLHRLGLPKISIESPDHSWQAEQRKMTQRSQVDWWKTFVCDKGTYYYNKRTSKIAKSGFLTGLFDPDAITLLIHTIDPNRVVEHPCIEYTLVAADGLPVSGLLFDETEHQLTVADGKGDLHYVSRRDIDDWNTTCRSQMTEGLEVNLTPQQMADLIAFISDAMPRDTSPGL